MGDEIQEIKTDLKECIKTTTENSLAIKELITLSSQATKDTDKLVKHLDNLIPIHEKVNGVNKRLENLEEEAVKGIRPETLKNLLKWAVAIILGFGTWITLAHFGLIEKVNDNKNQINYLKGRIK